MKFLSDQIILFYFIIKASINQCKKTLPDGNVSKKYTICTLMHLRTRASEDAHAVVDLAVAAAHDLREAEALKLQTARVLLEDDAAPCHAAGLLDHRL